MAVNNTCIHIGRLTADPELKKTNTDKSVCNFSLAVDRPFSNPKTSDFFNYVAWNKTAEFMNKYFHKGDKVAVQGVLTNRKYEAADGTTRYTTEIIVESVDFAGSKSSKNNADELDDDDLDDDDLPM